MSDWEPFDDELARALRRRAGADSHDPLDTASAHRAVLARASGIRRRRAAIAGSGTLTVLLFAGLLVLDDGGGDDGAVGTATDATSGSSVPATPSTTTGPTTSSNSIWDLPPGEYTWDADGGSLTIYWDGADLRLVSVDPNTGITAEVHDNTTDRIRIDFGDGSRIECRVDNGQLTLEIT